MYYSLRLFLTMAAGPAGSSPIGNYAGDKKKDDFMGALGALEKIQEPTMLVSPDAVLLTVDDWQAVSQQMLMHCGKMQSRVSLLDVYDGTKARTNKDDDVITKFRNSITETF